MLATNLPLRALNEERDQLETLKSHLGRLEAVAGDAQDDRCELLVVDSETGARIAIPRALIQVLSQATEVLASGGAVAVMPYHAKLTMQEAADYLGVSRPYLISLLDAGEIPYHRLRSHRRVLLKDIEEYRRRRDVERRAALAELTRESYRRGMYDLPDEAESKWPVCGSLG